MIASGYPTGTVAVELLTFAMGILAPGTEIKNVHGDKIGIAEQAIEK